MQFKDYVRESVKVGNLEFIKTSSDDVTVMANLKKFDQDWKDDSMYVGRGGKNGIGDRYRNFGTWLQKGEKIRMPEVSMLNGKPVFANGRHRTSWFIDKGLECMPFAVSQESAKEFKEKYGC